ncbi:MAG TPA: outer membrane beta-barrel protein [Pseudolabrys sp.]|nr:outer membrane beta-barrel protein [Pseudolabrys sp.]
MPRFAAGSTTLSTECFSTERGGAAFANVKFSNTYVGFSPGGSGNENEASSASETKTGWAAGGGIDYALTPNWIVSVKYLHVDLGSISASGLVTTGSTDNATMNFSTKLTSDLVRGGISYKLLTHDALLTSFWSKTPGAMSRGFSFGENQTPECPLLAQSGQPDRTRLCPLLG